MFAAAEKKITLDQIELSKPIEAEFTTIVDGVSGFMHKIGDAGYDMYLEEDRWIFPFWPRKMPVNFKAAIPPAHFGLMTSRSGESLKGNFVIPGIIDSGYRGQMAAIMCRIGLLPRKLKANTRIAQLIVIPYREVRWKKVDELDAQTERGDKGFGDSGKH